jgi:hypothetical protein
MQIVCFSVRLEEVFNQKRRAMEKHVSELPDAHFGETDRLTFSESVAAMFRLDDIPRIVEENIERDEPSFTRGRETVSVEVYFPVSGDPFNFRWYCHSYPVPQPQFDASGTTLSKTYTFRKTDLNKLDKEIESDLRLVRQYSTNCASMIPRYNESLIEAAGHLFDVRMRELQENNEALKKVAGSRFGIRRRNDPTSEVIVPVRRKSVLVSPAEPLTSPQEFVLGVTEYNDILSVMTSMAKVIERSPTVFAEMGEESLRTIMLVALNGIYEGQATGETFNGHGKTDILIRKDDRNVFIAECLMWKGQAYLKSKLDDQLFKYAMWRDSKLAVVIFNRGGNFTANLETMKETLRSHPQYVKDITWPHESGARFLFRRHDDPNRHFYLSAVAFDVAQKC